MGEVQLKHLPDQSYTMRESLRMLRTNIQFCGDDIKTILFTSAAPGEGKSSAVMNLARSLVDSKKKVLVIDADLRKSVMVGRLKATKEKGEIYGLSHYLSGQKRMGDVICTTQLQGLFMVFSGPLVPNPTELLEKKYFEDLIRFARGFFDYVLIDCPPLGAAIDAAVVARNCDGAIIVTAQGQESARVIAGVKRQLDDAGIKVLGAILNKVEMKKGGHYGKYYGRYYGRYYGSYYGKYYGKYYGADEENKKKKHSSGESEQQKK